MVDEKPNSGFSLDFEFLFPFYFKINNDFLIVEAGSSIKKKFPHLVGKSFYHFFQFRKDNFSANSFELIFIEDHIKKLFIFEAKHENFTFRGHFCVAIDHSTAIFLGNPVINSLNLMEDTDFELGDFALHDTINETIAILKKQEESTNKLKRKAENYLLESDLFHKIINLVPQQIFLKDSQSRFLLVNKKMSELFGADIKDIVGKTDRDFWPNSEEVDFYRDIDKKVIESNQRFEIAEEPQTRKDGRRCINHVVKMPFTLASGEKCILGIAIDITDIKETQQAKFEIASGVLHDIGNGVVGFGSYLNRIKRQLEQDNVKNLENLTNFFVQNRAAMVSAIGEPKAKALVEMLVGITNTQKSNIDEIKKSVTEQYNIIAHIQDILNIQRQYVDGQETVKERKPVDLRSIINDCISMAFASVDKRHISLSLDIQPKMPIIKGDRTKLMQVILNLFKNSIESIDINSEVKKINVKLFTLYDAIVLEIQDTGCGFDQYTASRLFERGFTTKPTGTGFGLHNCQQIIESHSGRIILESEGVGKGAKATIKMKIL